MPRELVRDYEIREALKPRLAAEHRGDPSTLIIDELGLTAERARVDVAVINGQFIGYEIKGDLDSPRRLSAQLDAYARCMDRVWVITGPRLKDKVANELPSWCGLLIARKTKGDVRFERQRKASAHGCISNAAVAALLWKRELIDLIVSNGHSGGALARESKQALIQLCVTSISPRRLRAFMREQLKQRGRRRLTGDLWRDPPAPVRRRRTASESWVEAIQQLGKLR